MEFTAYPVRNQPDVVEVRYDCQCGCKPRARYHRGADEANYEHCCCGRVHFVGVRADDRLRAYLEERRVRGEDADVTYTSTSFGKVTLAAPWGEPVTVAYAVPDRPRQH